MQIKVYYTFLLVDIYLSRNKYLRFSFFLFTLFYNYLIPEIFLSFYLGGGKEDRTPDPLLAKQVLSQLSYTPVIPYFRGEHQLRRCLEYLNSLQSLSLPSLR